MNYMIKHAENNNDLYSVLNFAEYIFGRSKQFDRTIWEVRFQSHPELLIYAEVDGQVIGAALSFVEDNGNITVGNVAVDEKYRKHGLAKALMTEIEKQSQMLGAKLIALASVETAEGFYQKLGYTGQMLIQSEKHTVDELIARNPGYPVVFTNVYDGKINQLCLRLDTPDRELQKLYENSLDGCYTQTMFWKKI